MSKVCYLSILMFSMIVLPPAYGEAPRNDTVSLRPCTMCGTGCDPAPLRCRGSNLKVSKIYANVWILAVLRAMLIHGIILVLSWIKYKKSTKERKCI